jgi:hypothetical protein
MGKPPFLAPSRCNNEVLLTLVKINATRNVKFSVPFLPEGFALRFSGTLFAFSSSFSSDPSSNITPIQRSANIAESISLILGLFGIELLIASAIRRDRFRNRTAAYVT